MRNSKRGCRNGVRLLQGRGAPYATAALLVTASMAAWRSLVPLWAASGGHVYLVAWPAIIAAAWIGGLGPGLFATMLADGSILVLFIDPPFTLRIHEPGDAIALAIFAGCGAVVSLLAEKLRRALRREERLRLARESVLGIVAHDLRNPLHSILFSAASLRARAADPDRALGNIERAGRRMDRLIRDLVDAAVVDHDGTLPVVLAEQDVLPIVREAVLAASAPAESKTITIEVDAPSAGLPRVRCDRERMLQVLENILGNAIKFTPERGRITMRLATLDDCIRLEISDTGPGIDRDQQALVFARHWSGRRAAGSAGLGLHIASGIVRGHGGRIWVESECGRGASFFVTLPIAPAAGREAEENASTAEARQ